MKKVSFTKIIMAVMMIINISVIAFLCVIMWRTGDLTPAPYLALGEGGALSVWLASYAYKEKCANRNKYAMQYVNQIAERYDIDTALKMAEIVLRY